MIMRLFIGPERKFPGETGIYQRRMVYDTAILLIKDDERHSVMSPTSLKEIVVLIPQLGRLLVADINIVGILHIVFLIDNGEERIGVHPLQLRVSLKSPLRIVPLIRE